jgi:hypothetical protein
MKGGPPCGSPEDWEKWGKDWEEWGESFGKKMEAKFSHGPPWHEHKKSLSVGGLIFSLFLLSWGVTWLGNELAWWSINFPFWPILVILIGLGFLIGVLKKTV